PPSLLHLPRLPSPRPSFPTRRSSDLVAAALPPTARRLIAGLASPRLGGSRACPTRNPVLTLRARAVSVSRAAGSANRERRKRHRSEEHTSELQSLTNLVCRLLLEKTK